MNYNKSIIVGNIVRDPEIKKTKTGISVCIFSVATNHAWKDRDGNKQTDTQFHNVVAYRGAADTIGQYMKKGNEILIEGRNINRSWEGEDGKKRYRHEIVVESFRFGRSPKDKTSHQEPQDAPGEPIGGEVVDGINVDDIPF